MSDVDDWVASLDVIPELTKVSGKEGQDFLDPEKALLKWPGETLDALLRARVSPKAMARYRRMRVRWMLCQAWDDRSKFDMTEVLDMVIASETGAGGLGREDYMRIAEAHGKNQISMRDHTLKDGEREQPKG